MNNIIGMVLPLSHKCHFNSVIRQDIEIAVQEAEIERLQSELSLLKGLRICISTGAINPSHDWCFFFKVIFPIYRMTSRVARVVCVISFSHIAFIGNTYF